MTNIRKKLTSGRFAGFRKLIPAAALCLMTLSASAQSAQSESDADIPRPVTSTYRIEIGGSSALSTYLSPIRYNGLHAGVSGTWSKALRQSPEHWIMEFEGALYWRSMRNPARTSIMVGLDGRFDWGLSYRWRLPYGIQLSAGPSLHLNGGALYMLRNGNNPVTAIAYAGIAARGAVSWRTKIGRLPVLVSNHVSLPTLGAFFCPEYGETYYEIWLGNHKNLAHCGWWGNAFAINNHLSVTLDFGRTAMEIGYRYSFNSYWANSLNTKVGTHAFTIGVIPGGIGLKNKSKVNYSIY